MKRKLSLVLFALGTSFFLSGCSLKKAPAALQINTTPEANVFINGKSVGKTPYSVSDFKAGEVSVKLIPESPTVALTSWENKIKLSSGVLTLIEREFATSEAGSSGQILTLEKIKDTNVSALSVISDPDGALVKINGEAKGFSPLTLDNAKEGEYEIVLAKEGYKEKIIKAKAALGYKLIVNVKLAQEGALAETGPTPTTGLSTETTPASGVTPASSAEITRPYVLIKDTPTGWLRVRAQANTSSAELAKVDPGEKYPLLDEETDWYKIAYSEGKEGWISAQYTQKFE